MDADLVCGHGRPDGPRRVAVETRNDGRVVVFAQHAVAVCTGSGAALPDLPGIAEVRPWISRDATSASTVLERLAIVGGGGVGTEMASAYQGLGASVTLLVRGEGLLHDGRELEADEVLPAIGRTPLTDDIGLETVGLTPGSWLEVDETCRVRAIDDCLLHAMGDVDHHARLTHQGKYQARIAGAALAARAAGRPLDTAPWGAYAATADFHAVPQVFFCDPEAAAVGLSAERAERAGHRVRAVDVDLSQVDGALPGVAELLHSATVAVTGQAPVDRLWHAVPCFPSISEVWLRLLEADRG